MRTSGASIIDRFRVAEERRFQRCLSGRSILPSRQILAENTFLPWTSYTGIVLFDGTCGARETRLVTIRFGNVTFHHLFQVTLGRRISAAEACDPFIRPGV